MGADGTGLQEFYPRRLSFARGQSRQEVIAETNAAPELREHERACDHSRTDCRSTDRAETDDCGCGILNRRPDLGGAAVGAGRIRLFPRRRRGLYARRAAAADGYS